MNSLRLLGRTLSKVIPDLKRDGSFFQKENHF